MGADGADVQAHADGNQEHTQEQALERLYGDFDLAAVFGAGQQQPGDQRPQRHGQAGGGGGKAGGHHHQQAGGDEKLRTAGAGYAAEQRTQHQATERHDRGDRQSGLADGETDTGIVRRTQRADREQHRHHRQILKQQHGKSRSAGRRIKPLFLRQDLDHHSGR